MTAPVPVASGLSAASPGSTRAGTTQAAAAAAPVDDEWDLDKAFAGPARIESAPDPSEHTAPTSRPPPISQDAGELEVNVVDDDIDFEELGITPSIPPPQSAEDVPHYAEEIAFLLKQEFEIALIGATDCTLDTLQGIEKVMFKRMWLDDETAMRNVIARLMHAMDPASYPLEGDWNKVPYKDVRNAFMAELSRRPKLANVLKELKKPPPLPA